MHEQERIAGGRCHVSWDSALRPLRDDDGSLSYWCQTLGVLGNHKGYCKHMDFFHFQLVSGT
jgi:hypothetical protein